MSPNHPFSSLARTSNQELAMDGVELKDVAREFGTPTYVYSAQMIRDNFLAYKNAFGARDHLVCYAVKANSNLSVLRMLAGLGAGFDIVSGGELKRVLAAGASADRVIFSGVGKSADEIALAIQAGVHCFNIESEPELERIAQIASKLGKVAPISVRVNPNVDAKTHPYISTGLKTSKFGVPHERVLPVYRRAASLPNIRIVGIEAHIGSQLLDEAPLLESLERLRDLVAALANEGIDIEHIDNGGGLGVRYTAGEDGAHSPNVTAYIAKIIERVGGLGKTLLVEPGRSIVANAGVLLTRVEYLKTDKEQGFCIVDASMSELLRPMLYQAHHEITEVTAPNGEAKLYDVVGPVCESSDVLGRGRSLAVREGDLLAVLSAGAYGFVMASNYNTRGLPAEVLIDSGNATCIRPRQTIEEILQSEQGA
jgi:diaminopimelate decarboxylase